MIRAPQPVVATVRLVPDLDPLAGGLPDFFWHRPAHGEWIAGWGSSRIAAASRPGQVKRALRELVNTEVIWRGVRGPGPWLGGVAFDGRQPCWPGFPAARWVVPERLAWRDGRGTFECGFEGRALPAPSAARDRDERRPATARRFGRLVDRAVGRIRAQRLGKVVVARAIDREVHDLDVRGLLRRLAADHPSCTVFALRAASGWFVGATPETLGRISGGELLSESLAGTALRGTSARAFGAKERSENDWVVEGLKRPLAGLVATMRVGPCRAMQVGNLAHLKRNVRAQLRPGVTPDRVLLALHPTPAVAGVPRASAMAFLRRYEGLRRGWYAGAIGWMGPDRAHWVVGIRSALLTRGRARLFAGAGIVEGSTPDGEWAETQLKSEAIGAALEAARVR